MADKLTSSGLARLHDAAQRHVADDNVPGLVALVASGEQVHVEALGRLSAGGPPVARDSLFRTRPRPSRSPARPRWRWSRRA